MKKLKRIFDVKYDLSWTCGVELSQLREDIDAIEKLGATSVNIEIVSEYGNDYVSAKAFALREETDEECIERIQQQAKSAEKFKQMELAQLEILKLKYGQ